MNIDLVRQFLEVARQGSFVAVARAVGRDPSSISRAIGQLEDDLRVRLFHRTTRQLSLTAAGQTFLRRTEGIISEIDAIRDDLRREDASPSGLVRVSASVAFGQACLLPHLGRFQERYPDLQLDLQLTDRNVDLVAEQVDFAFRLAPSLQIDVIGRKLFDSHYRVLASPAYLEKHGWPETPSDLAARRMLCFDLPAFRERWIFRDGLGRDSQVPITPCITISSALALREAALEGMGPVLLADWLAGSEIARGRLIDLFPDYQVTATNFETGAWLIYSSRSFMPGRTRAAIDFFTDALAAQSAPSG